MGNEDRQNAEEYSSVDEGNAINPALAQWALDPQKTLTRLRARLQGKTISYPQGSMTISTKGENPMMNDRGIQLFCDLLLGTISETMVTISNFDEKTECNLSRDIMHTMTISLWCDYDEYGIEMDDNNEPNLAILDNIKAATRPFVRGVLRQAYNEGIRNWLKKAPSERLVYKEGRGRMPSLT